MIKVVPFYFKNSEVCNYLQIYVNIQSIILNGSSRSHVIETNITLFSEQYKSNMTTWHGKSHTSGCWWLSCNQSKYELLWVRSQTSTQLYCSTSRTLLLLLRHAALLYYLLSKWWHDQKVRKCYNFINCIMYNENFKHSSEKQKDSNRCKKHPCCLVGRINTVKMAIFMKKIYIYNSITIKLPIFSTQK